MADVELILKVGGNELQARGPQDWVSGQGENFLGRYSLEFSNEGFAGDDATVEADDKPSTQISDHRNVNNWLKQFEIPRPNLEEIFDLSQEIPELIVGEAPGNKLSEKVVNLYFYCNT